MREHPGTIPMLKAKVKNPGSRGGKGYYDEKGNWQYGEKKSASGGKEEQQRHPAQYYAARRSHPDPTGHEAEMRAHEGFEKELSKHPHRERARQLRDVATRLNEAAKLVEAGKPVGSIFDKFAPSEPQSPEDYAKEAAELAVHVLRSYGLVKR